MPKIARRAGKRTLAEATPEELEQLIAAAWSITESLRRVAAAARLAGISMETLPEEDGE